MLTLIIFLKKRIFFQNLKNWRIDNFAMYDYKIRLCFVNSFSPSNSHMCRTKCAKSLNFDTRIVEQKSLLYIITKFRILNIYQITMLAALWNLRNFIFYHCNSRVIVIPCKSIIVIPWENPLSIIEKFVFLLFNYI